MVWGLRESACATAKDGRGAGRKAALAGCLLAAAASGCDEPSSPAQETGADPSIPRGCPPPPGAPTRPESIEEVVALLGALPVPTTLPCFLESLERPLEVIATTNAFSAQPSDGPDNPRLLIVSGPLTMAIVPNGIGRHLLEMAVDVGDRESIKAELAFPLNEPVSNADPYEHILQPGGGTTCNGCHAAERRADVEEDYGTEIFVSGALQSPPDEVLSVSFARQVAAACDGADESLRCGTLVALFGHGEVSGGRFPPDNLICRAP
ncbi:MAG: hypothetical protein AAF721_37935 [Myxococcota bacterium]